MKFLNFLPHSCTAIGLLALLISSTGCQNRKPRMIKSPPHYNFGEVYTHKLDIKLKEISGLAWDNKNDEFVAHYDEAGKLFYLDKETKVIKAEYTFGKKGDYEDVVLINSIPFVLRSDGMITKVNKDSTGKIYGEELGKIGITGVNDFEAMYYDPTRNALVLICKNCALDNKSSVSAFAYYFDSTGFDNKPVFTIDAKEVERLSPHKTSKFQPSAAAIHPVLQKLFILSSASNQLAIVDLDGKVEAVFELGKKLFPQPEGLTFKSNGDMYISNEGVISKATILRFVYKP
ncbi:MAG TPA: SdiA-regulated domain-containing protein [Chitinophagaceae bacterium]|nr:SdiA-regulated domain-containing protein [Chitinophagaceae bacterium]